MDYKQEFNGFNIHIKSKNHIFDWRNGKITINNKDISQWIRENYISNESGKIKMVSLSNEFKLILNTLFSAIKDIEVNLNDKASANHIAGHFFNHFKGIWRTNLNKYSAFMEIDLWDHLLAEVINWENNNDYKIHKGTPYYFNAGNYLIVGHYDFAWNYVYKAIEEDRFHGLRRDSNFDYRSLPAYSLATLNIDNPHNYLYQIVLRLSDKINHFISLYDQEYNDNFTFNTFRNKFLNNISDYENEILYFVYLLRILMDKSYLIRHFNLFNNEFAKMRNLNIIFAFCLLLDKIMEKKTNREYISISSKELIKKLNNNFNNSHTSRLKNLLKWDDTNPIPIMNTINFMLQKSVDLYPINNIYTPEINKKIINTILIWFLRNKGAHNLKLENLNTEIFETILQSLFNQLFIIIDKLL